MAKLMITLAALCLAHNALASPTINRRFHREVTEGPAQTDICKTQEDGVLIVDPSCKECFFECNHHFAFRFHCPPGLIFSEAGKDKGCIPDPNAPQVQVPCNTGSKFECKGKSDGFYPDDSDHTKFHECVHGCGADFVCPPTTAWDNSRQVCAFDSNAHNNPTNPPVTNPPETTPTPHHEEVTTPTPHHEEDTTPTPTHWTPDPWTPPHITDAPVTHEDTTPTHWAPDTVTPPVTEPHHEDTTPTPHHEEITTQPPVTPPNSGEQTTRGRHGDPISV